MRGRDVLEIVETAYDLDCDDQTWLQRLAETVLATVPFPVLGVVANGYDISDPERPRFDVGFHCAAPDAADFLRGWGDLVQIFAEDRERTRRSYGALDEGFGLEIPAPGNDRLAAAFSRVDMGDVYGVNGRNTSGQGVFLGIAMPRRYRPVSPSTRQTYARIARHIAAAYRLRLRIRPLEARHGEAILSLDGKVEHATGKATAKTALAELRRCVVSVATLRTRTRLDDPDRAVATWKALVDARWSLVDHFERSGKHYLVAHRNDPAAPPALLLTERERQVAMLAAMGHANKAIAYDLGIATSTVGVLISRALKRLGLRSRRQLAAYMGVSNNDARAKPRRR